MGPSDLSSRRRLLQLIGDECGSPLVEYALAGSLIAVVTVGAVALIGGKVGGVYQALADIWP